MQEKVLYSALFVNDIEDLQSQYPPVYQNLFYHHSTIEFNPSNGINGLNVGEKRTIKIFGRVTSDKVDVLLVENKKSKNENPHITLSTIEGVRPMESNIEIKNAIVEGRVTSLQDEIDVTEGYFAGDSKVVK